MIASSDPDLTFFQAPRWDGVSGGVVFSGVPYDRTSEDHPGGSKLAPAALRQASLQFPAMVDEPTGLPLGWTFDRIGGNLLAGVRFWDVDDLALPSSLTGEEADRRVTAETARLLARGTFPVMLGGEHALTRGALRAVAAARNVPISLVILDAHADRGLSHWGGRYARDSFVDGILQDGTVGSVLQVGLRDIHHPANAPLPPSLTVLSPGQARRLGPRGLAALIPVGTEVYLSLDIDALSPEVAPATRTPLPGGFALDELLELLSCLCSSPSLVAIDLNELDPTRDRDGLTLITALHLLLTLLGLRFRAVEARAGQST